MHGGNTYHIADLIALNDDFSLLKSMNAFFCLPAPPRPRTTNCLKLVDVLQPILENSRSWLNPSVRIELLKIYPDPLQINLPMILCFGAQPSYEGHENFILSKKLLSALVDI